MNEAGDLNLELNLIETEDPKITRWLFFAGDVLSREFKQQRPHLPKDGGIDAQAVTLYRTGGFIRRGRFTPMIFWVEGEIQEHANKNARHGKLQDYIPVNDTENKGYHTRSTLLGIARTPKSERQQVVDMNHRGTRYGITEVTSLKGVTYEDFPQTEYQQLFFANRYNTDSFPRKLAELRKLIAAAEGTGEKFKDTKDTLLAACQQFQVFGETYLEAQNNLVRMPPTRDGFTFQYSSTAEVLFEQLDYERVDAYLNKQARQGADVAQALDRLAAIQEQIMKGNTDAKSAEVLAMMQAQMEEQRKALQASQEQMKQLQEQLASAVAVGKNPPQNNQTRR